MNIMLFIIVVVLFGFNYWKNSYHLLHPTVIVCGVFSLSALFLNLNPKWDYVIHLNTLLFIVASLITFSLGSIIINGISKKNCPQQLSKNKDNLLAIEVKLPLFGILFCFSFIITILYFFNQYKLSLRLGNFLGLRGMIKSLRSFAFYSPWVFELNPLLKLGLCFANALGYISLLLAIKYLLDKNLKKAIIYLLPFTLMVINAILSTGRSEFITILVTVIVDFYIIQKAKDIKNIDFILIFFVLFSSIVFFVFFRLTGYLSGNSKILNFMDTLSIYIGSPLVCLDSLLQTEIMHPKYFGNNTFAGIYNILIRFGLHIPKISEHHAVFRWANDTYNSNIYTSFYPYIVDFGLVVSVTFQFLLGMLFTRIWNIFIEFKGNLFFLFLYGPFFCNALVYYSIEERMFSKYISFNKIFEIIFYVVLSIFLIKHKGVFQRRKNIYEFEQ